MTQNHVKIDQQIQSAGVKALDCSPGVESEYIGVAATDGAVTLSGEVATLPKRDVAVETAIRVHSVAERVDLIVRRHLTTLKGHVYSWNERREAELAVWSARGITDVHNDLVVAP